MKEIKQYKSVEWDTYFNTLEELMLEHDKWDIFQILPYWNMGTNHKYIVVLVRSVEEEQSITDLPETGTGKINITSRDIVIGMKFKCVKSAFGFNSGETYLVKNIFIDGTLFVTGGAYFGQVISPEVVTNLINDGSLEIIKHVESV